MLWLPPAPAIIIPKTPDIVRPGDPRFGFAASLPGLAGLSGKGIDTITSDPNFSNRKLLMGYNDVNGSVGAPGMTDESGAAHGTATVVGSPAISTAQSVFGGSSLLLNGGGHIEFADSADWDLSNQPFTIEFRYRPTTVTSTIQFIIDQWVGPQNGWALYQNNAGLSFHGSTTGSNDVAVIDVTSGLAVNTQAAICVDFDGTKYRMYINGAMVGSSTSLITFFNSSNPLYIGVSPGSGFFVNAYLDELRFTKGLASYASDSGYTVATSPFPRS